MERRDEVKKGAFVIQGLLVERPQWVLVRIVGIVAAEIEIDGRRFVVVALVWWACSEALAFGAQAR